MIDRLVAYGCSFTAGDELCEHEVLPDADIIKRGKDSGEFTKILWNSAERKAIDDMYARQRQIAYPGIIANKLGIKLDNRAKPGNSIEGILLNIISDITTSSINQTDLVVIGLTHVDRIVHLRGNDLYYVHLGHPSTWPTLKSYEQIINHYNNETLFFHYYVTLNSLIKICHENFPGRFFIVKSCHWRNLEIPDNISDKFKKSITYLKTSSETGTQLILDKSLYDFIDNYNAEVHGLGHPNHGVHVKFAEYLYPQIVKRLQ